MKHQMMIPKPSDLMEVEVLDWSDRMPPHNSGAYDSGMYDVTGGDLMPSFNPYTINLCSIIHHGYKKFILTVPDINHTDYPKYEEAVRKQKEDFKKWKEDRREGRKTESDVEYRESLGGGMTKLSPAHPMMREPIVPPMKEEIIECTEVVIFPAISLHINIPYTQFRKEYIDFLEIKHSPI